MENKKTKRIGSFEALDPNKPIFKEIKEQKWWKLFREDKELYIEIRKDNYINVYFYGGSLAKIKYNRKNEFVAEIHEKFVGKDGKKYIKLDLNGLDKEKIDKIKKRIKTIYLKESKKKEKLKEKEIQGEILKNQDYIDSEFAYRGKDNNLLRIDLVELSKDVLSFVELKGILDGRLLNDETQNFELPKIIKQMNKYKKFISDHKSEIKDYYEKIIQIKNDLGILKQNPTNFTINENPKLIIADTYKKSTPAREDRIKKIEDKLGKQDIDCKIIKWPH